VFMYIDVCVWHVALNYKPRDFMLYKYYVCLHIYMCVYVCVCMYVCIDRVLVDVRIMHM
jgi:hypothetical protein